MSCGSDRNAAAVGILSGDQVDTPVAEHGKPLWNGGGIAARLEDQIGTHAAVRGGDRSGDFFYILPVQAIDIGRAEPFGQCGPPWIFPGCDDRYMGNSGRGQIRDGEESYWTQPLHHCGAGRFDAGIGPVRKLKGVEGRRTRAGAYADGLGIKAVRDTDQVFDRGKACLGVTAPKVGRLLGIARIRHPHVEAVRVVSASAEGTGAAGTSDIDNDRIFGTDTAAFAVFAMDIPYPAHEFVA